jgi:hypothetical protein
LVLASYQQQLMLGYCWIIAGPDNQSSWDLTESYSSEKFSCYFSWKFLELEEKAGLKSLQTRGKFTSRFVVMIGNCIIVKLQS